MKRRNKALTVLFSFIPGAGQMWQGFLLCGFELMIAFFGTIFISVLLNADLLFLFLPVIVAYSFFESLNRMSLDDENFYALPDSLTILNGKNVIKDRKSAYIAGGICLIAIGVVALWNGAYNMIWRVFEGYFSYADLDMLDTIFSQIPKVVLSLGAIVGGIVLIAKKKKEIDNGDNK